MGSASRFVREPAVWMVLVSLVVQLWRAYPVDIALHVVILILMAIEWPRTRDRLVDATPPRLAPRPRLLGLGCALVYALAVSFVPQTTWLLDACLAVPGLAALWVAVGPRRRVRWRSGAAATTPPTPRNWWVWPGLAVGLALVELYSLLSQPGPRADSVAHPTLSTLVEPLLSSQLHRAAALVVWVLLGWWLVRRIRTWREASWSTGS